MSRGIIIFGSAGSGKTTLGRRVAQSLKFPYFDIDDYIWRTDTPQPYSVMYPREEKASRLMRAISTGEHFVMAGSMDSFHAPFVPLFDLAVHLTADIEVRLDRLHNREYAKFGARILEGGDLYEMHQRFLDVSARYDSDGSPSMGVHARWAETLPCMVLRLDGGEALEKNAQTIIDAYQRAVGGTPGRNSNQDELSLGTPGLCAPVPRQRDSIPLETLLSAADAAGNGRTKMLSRFD